ncbi:MAG TPA: hypothetical protein VEC38_14300 [Candidatus Binataceae bacterium]|nr:hypothetical protein [Candidatus Binataceae bacterium]
MPAHRRTLTPKRLRIGIRALFRAQALRASGAIAAWCLSLNFGICWFFSPEPANLDTRPSLCRTTSVGTPKNEEQIDEIYD